MAKRLFFKFLPMLILPTIMVGCDGSAEIKGKVLDEGEKPLAGVKVLLKQGNHDIEEQSTNESGRIDVFGPICPMPWCSSDISVTLSKPGYRSVEKHFKGNGDD